MENKTECQWHPELHNGRPCPIHKGGNVKADFDAISPENYLFAEEVKKNLYDTEGNKITHNRFDDVIDDAILNAKSENIALIKKHGVKLIITNEKSSYEQNGRSYLNEEAFKDWDPEYGIRFNGETMFHENAHGIDEKCAKSLNNLSPGERITVMTWAGVSSKNTMASSCYKSEYNGMTLHETVAKEFKKIKETDIQEMLSEIDEYQDEIIRSKGLDPKEFRKLDKELQNLVGASYVDYKAKYNEISAKFPDNGYKWQARRKFKKDFTVVSDVISSRYYQSDEYGSKSRGLGIGHSEYYYAKYKAFGLGAEFFANVFAADTANQQSVLDVTRAYFPESMKVYEELIKKMKEV